MFESSRGRQHSNEAPGPKPGSIALETLVRKDRLLVVCALILAVLSAWAWLLLRGSSLGGGTAPASPEGGLGPLAGAAVMWCVMMVAMMLPSATPMVLAFARAARANAGAIAPTMLFAAAYIGSWALVSIVAAGLQHFLIQIDAIDPSRLVFREPTSSALVLITFGVYQLTPLKRACLELCRAPSPFFIRYWREGPARPLRLGMIHALSCLGCSGMLVPMLFVAGVTNLFWVGALGLELVIEKTAPKGDLIARLLGAAAALAGLGLLVDQAFTRFP